MPTTRFLAGSPDGLVAELRALLHSLEELFEDPGLARLRRRSANHEAVRTWNYLERLLESSEVPYGEEIEIGRAMAGLILDRQTWRELKPSNASGSIITWEAARKIRSRIIDSDQYADVLAELHVFGHLSSLPLSAELREEEGESDIVVRTDRLMPVEVKRLRLGTKPSRVKKVLERANRQLKATAPSPGLLYLLVERDGERVSLDDQIPSDIAPFVETVQTLIGGYIFKSVAHVVVAWDEVSIDGSLLETSGILSFFRKSTVLSHRTPRAFVDVDLDAMRPNNVIVRSLAYESSDEEEALKGYISGALTFSDEFRQVNEYTDGIRSRHVRDMAQPTARMFLRAGDFDLFLATRYVQKTPAYVVLVVATGKAGSGRLVVHGAYKLFDDPTRLPLVDFSQAPLTAFLELLDRFGHDVQAGNVRGRLIPHVTFPADDLPLLALPRGVDIERTTVHAYVKSEQHGNRPIAHVVWVFGIDAGRYLSAAIRRLGLPPVS